MLRHPLALTSITFLDKSYLPICLALQQAAQCSQSQQAYRATCRLGV